MTGSLVIAFVRKSTTEFAYFGVKVRFNKRLRHLSLQVCSGAATSL